MAGDRHADALIETNGQQKRRTTMPVILWLLGVPLSVILLLMLVGGL
jgi:hypothetical protein